MRGQTVQLAGDEVLDAVGFTLSLIVAVGFVALVWWLGKITRLWWLLGVLRERWQSGLPGAGPCEWLGCPADALRYGRYCAEHEYQERVRYEESRRWS